MIEEPESFERLLDQALQSYSSAEPRPGLEQRIDARVVAHQMRLNQPRRKLSPLWLGAVASLVTVLAVVAISMRSTPRKREVARQTPALTNPITEAQTITITKQSAHRPQRRRVSHPTPPLEHGQPQLTESDRLMVQLASVNPQEALIFSQLRKSSNKPIATSPLQVQPLASNPIVIAPIAMNHDEHASF